MYTLFRSFPAFFALLYNPIISVCVWRAPYTYYTHTHTFYWCCFVLAFLDWHLSVSHPVFDFPLASAVKLYEINTKNVKLVLKKNTHFFFIEHL